MVFGGLKSGRLVLIKQPQRSWTLVKGEAGSPVVLCFSLRFIFYLEPFVFHSIDECLGAVGRSSSDVSNGNSLADALPVMGGLGWAGVDKKPVIQLMRFPWNFSILSFLVRRRLQYSAVIVSFGSKSFRKQDHPLFSLKRLVILSIQRSLEFFCH